VYQGQSQPDEPDRQGLEQEDPRHIQPFALTEPVSIGPRNIIPRCRRVRRRTVILEGKRSSQVSEGRPAAVAYEGGWAARERDRERESVCVCAWPFRTYSTKVQTKVQAIPVLTRLCQNPDEGGAQRRSRAVLASWAVRWDRHRTAQTHRNVCYRYRNLHFCKSKLQQISNYKHA
jgi:hypothetical protein